MLSVQLEQGRHSAISLAQAEVRTRGGNALLGVSFTGTPSILVWKKRFILDSRERALAALKNRR